MDHRRNVAHRRRTSLRKHNLSRGRKFMKGLRYVSGKLIMLAIACSFIASTPIQAEEAKSNAASARSGDNARLVVNRAANFGILESVNVFIDGVQVAELELSQSYDAVLPPGEHVLSISINPKTDGQRPTQRRFNAKPGETYAFTAVWRSAEHASLEQMNVAQPIQNSRKRYVTNAEKRRGIEARRTATKNP